MKNILKISLFSIALLSSVSATFAQAKKPTIMVVPSDVWCNKNGYMQEFDNQGTVVKVPDYKKALQEKTEEAENPAGKPLRKQVPVPAAGFL